jgi:hypothetical protein
MYPCGGPFRPAFRERTMSNDHLVKRAQEQARRGYAAPNYPVPKPAFQVRQVIDAAFKSARNQNSSKGTNGGR